MWATLLTILITGGVTVTGTLVVTQRGWRREDELRWVPERRKAYSDFLAAVNRWDDLDHEAAMYGEIEEFHETPPEDRLEPLTGEYTSGRIRPRANAAAAKAAERLADMELVGSKVVVAAATALRDEMNSLSNVRYISPPRSCGGASDDLNEAWTQFEAVRDAYKAAVRAELGSD